MVNSAARRLIRRPLDLACASALLGAHYDGLRRRTREQAERAERRLAARPGGNRGRRITDRKIKW